MILYVTLISVCSNSHRFFSGEAGSSVGVNQSALAVIAVMWEQDELLHMFYLPASLWCLFCTSHILITGYNTYSVFSIQIPLQRNWRQDKSQDMVFVSMLQTGNDANRRTPIEWCWNVCLGVVLDIKLLKELQQGWGRQANNQQREQRSCLTGGAASRQTDSLWTCCCHRSLWYIIHW